MGVITVSISGSFMDRPTERFSALHGGHAQAVAETIHWLSEQVLPKAIQQDHVCARRGEKPGIGFGKHKPADTVEQGPIIESEKKEENDE